MPNSHGQIRCELDSRQRQLKAAIYICMLPVARSVGHPLIIMQYVSFSLLYWQQIYHRDRKRSLLSRLHIMTCKRSTNTIMQIFSFLFISYWLLQLNAIVKHKITRIRIQIDRWSGVRPAPVCVLIVLEVLMAFFRAFNCRILCGLYLPTVILTVIWYSITHSLFLSRLKTFILYKSFPLQPFLSLYLNIYYMDSPDCLLLFLGMSVFYFQFFSVFTLFSCRFRAVD